MHIVYITVIESVSVSGSQYGRPNRSISLINVNCDGSELRLDDCGAFRVTQGSDDIFQLFNVAGVQCGNATVSMSSPITGTAGYTIATYIMVPVIIILIVALVG